MWIDPHFADAPVLPTPPTSVMVEPGKPSVPAIGENAWCDVLLIHPWQTRLLTDIQGAQQSVVITALSMLPPRSAQRGPWPDAWHALCARAQAGVVIQLTLPAPSRAHPATSQNATAATTAHAHGWTVTLLNSPRLLHAKQFIIDQRIIWIGSANLTAAAYAHNQERWARIESRTFGERLVCDIGKLPHQSG